VRELREFPKPIIAMIHGFCMGGGVVMAMGADMRIGSDDSVYCIPVARLGVCYPIAAIDRLNQLVGPSHASDLLFTARHVNADEAARIGLINRVVPKADLDGHVRALAKQIAGNAPLTVRAIEDRGRRSCAGALRARRAAVDRHHERLHGQRRLHRGSPRVHGKAATVFKGR
jgi:enoyl-CoA hydratase/carnithine racemase